MTFRKPSFGPAAGTSARRRRGASRLSSPKERTHTQPRKMSLSPFSHKNEIRPRSVFFESGIDDAGRQGVGCRSDSEPREGASENSPGFLTLGNAAPKKIPKPRRGRQSFLFPRCADARWLCRPAGAQEDENGPARYPRPALRSDLGDRVSPRWGSRRRAASRRVAGGGAPPGGSPGQTRAD